MHHTIGPDLDTIRAVLNSTFRRFGSPPFLSRSPPFATATFFIPGEWATDPMCVRARVCVCACHRKRDNPSRVSRETAATGNFAQWLRFDPSFFLFQRIFFFFFFLFSSFCFSFSKKSGSHSQFPTSFVFKNLILFGVNVRLNVLRLVLIIIVRPCEDNCM